VLGTDHSSSIELVKRLMTRMPGCPQLYLGVVDVRDVADLHLRAMTDPAAKGERFIATAGNSLWMVEIARVLRRRMGAAARRVPTRVLPNWLVRLSTRGNPVMRTIVPLLGLNMDATSDKARRMLGWAPRSSEEAIVAAAESLLRLGMVRDAT